MLQGSVLTGQRIFGLDSTRENHARTFHGDGDQEILYGRHDEMQDTPPAHQRSLDEVGFLPSPYLYERWNIHNCKTNDDGQQDVCVAQYSGSQKNSVNVH